jgi:hypothetical protein
LNRTTVSVSYIVADSIFNSTVLLDNLDNFSI